MRKVCNNTDYCHNYTPCSIMNYFSILILASTATTFFGLPSNGLRSISAISGAAITKADTLAICSA